MNDRLDGDRIGVKKSTRKWKRLKEDLVRDLQAPDFAQSLAEIHRMPPRQVINPLISLFLSSDELVRWRAITAAGRVVADLADKDMEGARTIMRRFMWMLNDESGGIGWGVPEAMGEVVASHLRLGKEYAGILVSYVCPERNYLEYEPLQQGALWAIGRVAEVETGLVKESGPCLVPNLSASNVSVKGLSVRALGLMEVNSVKGELMSLLEDHRKLSLFVGDELSAPTVSGLAQDALSRLAGHS